MSELNDVIGGNTITASFTNEVKERSLMRYATAATRDTSIPAPVAGSLAWLEDVSNITVYDGAVWITINDLHSDLSDISTSQHHVKYTDGESVSAARGDFGARPLASARGGGTNKTLTTSVNTVLDIWSVQVDPDGLMSTSTFVCPETGFYLITAAVNFETDVVGQRTISLLVEGVAMATSDKIASVGDDFLITSLGIYLQATDTIQVRAFQSSGGDLDIDNSDCRFGVVKVSD